MKPLANMQRALRALPPPSFDWKGGGPDDVIGEIDEDSIDAFKEISSIAAVAYVIATVEWLHFYVREHLDPDDAADYEQYITAHWVWVCELPRRMRPAPYERKSREIRLPMAFNDAVEIGLESITNGIGAVRDHETAVDAAFMTQLCEYVLPPESNFGSWRVAMLQRLSDLFPADRTHYDQVRVARRLFDQEIDVRDINSDTDCSDIVSCAAVEVNRYLPLEPAE